MKTINPELKELEKQKNSLWKTIKGFEDCFFLYEQEAMYLMKGHATELIDLIQIKSLYHFNEIKIFGVVAADKSKGKYVWIYLYHRNRLIKCRNLINAYDKIKIITAISELEFKINKLETKLKAQEKMLQVCKN